MSMIVERHQFSAMTDAEKTTLVREFASWDGSVFRAEGDPSGYWLDAKAAEVVVYVLRSSDRTLCGYATIKYYVVPYEGRDIWVKKFGIGVTPEHRGSKFALRSIVAEYLRWRLRHPLRELHLFATMIHPVTYKLVINVFGKKLYPYFEGPQDPAKERMALFLADHFGLKKADSPHPFVYVEEYSAIENQEANTYWKTSTRPEVRFFLDHCPHYDTSGDSIITTAPFDLSALIGAFGTLARNRVDRLFKRKPQFSRRG